MIPSQLRRQLLKWVVQLVLSVALLLGLLSFAGHCADALLDLWPELDIWPAIVASLVWSVTLLLALPVLGLAVAKLRVLVVICVDMRDVPETDSLELAPDRSRRYLLLGAVLLGLVVLGICLYMAIPRAVTIGFLIMYAGLTWVSVRGLQKFYQQIGAVDGQAVVSYRDSE